MDGLDYYLVLFLVHLSSLGEYIIFWKIHMTLGQLSLAPLCLTPPGGTGQSELVFGVDRGAVVSLEWHLGPGIANVARSEKMCSFSSSFFQCQGRDVGRSGLSTWKYQLSYDH